MKEAYSFAVCRPQALHLPGRNPILAGEVVARKFRGRGRENNQFVRS